MTGSLCLPMLVFLAFFFGALTDAPSKVVCVSRFRLKHAAQPRTAPLMIAKLRTNLQRTNYAKISAGTALKPLTPPA